MVKTGQSGGLDVFFGNGYNGKIPQIGSVVLVEYLITDGEPGNINSMESNTAEQWKFTSSGYAINSEEIDLNKLSEQKLYQFLFEHNLGIDCSGLATYILQAVYQENKKINNPHFPGNHDGICPHIIQPRKFKWRCVIIIGQVPGLPHTD